MPTNSTYQIHWQNSVLETSMATVSRIFFSALARPGGTRRAVAQSGASLTACPTWQTRFALAISMAIARRTSFSYQETTGELLREAGMARQSFCVLLSHRMSRDWYSPISTEIVM